MQSCLPLLASASFSCIYPLWSKEILIKPEIASGSFQTDLHLVLEHVFCVLSHRGNVHFFTAFSGFQGEGEHSINTVERIPLPCQKNSQTFFKIQRNQNIIPLYWLHCLCRKQVFTGCSPKEGDFMVTRYFFDVVLFPYKVLLPWQQHASKSTLFPFYYYVHFPNITYLKSLYLQVVLWSFVMLSFLLSLCYVIFFSLNVLLHCLSQYIVSLNLPRITLVVL